MAVEVRHCVAIAVIIIITNNKVILIKITTDFIFMTVLPEIF
jgi:hypothetical protein